MKETIMWHLINHGNPPEVGMELDVCSDSGHISTGFSVEHPSIPGFFGFEDEEVIGLVTHWVTYKYYAEINPPEAQND